MTPEDYITTKLLGNIFFLMREKFVSLEILPKERKIKDNNFRPKPVESWKTTATGHSPGHTECFPALFRGPNDMASPLIKPLPVFFQHRWHSGSEAHEKLRLLNTLHVVHGIHEHGAWETLKDQRRVLYRGSLQRSFTSAHHLGEPNSCSSTQQQIMLGSQLFLETILVQQRVNNTSGYWINNDIATWPMGLQVALQNNCDLDYSLV
ncbi:hypothetical protein JRQ81_011609 [Phrynocephalus forsythii]|uniref:Uncharacterized protein n=1 Tax=Phrynocephalus forsythii TaxID=171643 RepID=A0A9Q0X669_9SAUR|nr:hypothetical protein JRQ81_011609 [Phrynocephalus forsythii]